MSCQPIAIVTGCTGQDGSYLCEFLLSKGYEVHGIVRRTSSPNLSRINHITNLITLHNADLSDQGAILRIISDIKPDEVYNLAAQSFVATSWEQPITTSDMTAIGVTRILESINYVNTKYDKNIRFYQASSSEMYGKVQSMPQNESTPFYPRSPYGVSKLYGHWMTINYRESYNMYAVSGILFNHESPRRGLEFVTRKISNAVARIKLGKQDKLLLGNLDAIRDWGYAGDYVRAMWMMLQQDTPKDYVIATNKTYSVRDFVVAAFSKVDLDWQRYVDIDPRLFRPAEVNVLCGDASLAEKDLGWKPEVDFQHLVEMMVNSDLELESRNA